MPVIQRYGCLLFAVFITAAKLCAQQAGSLDSIYAVVSQREEQPTPFVYTIRTIEIAGNKKTKTPVILRELSFQEGDQFTLQQLVKKFEMARRQLMNTTLFHDAVVALKTSEGAAADILVDVKERWYVFPSLHFKPADRNLNQWIVEKNANLNRVNYGVRLLYNNISGHNDKIETGVTGGYTRQLSFSYERPFVDKKMKWGIGAGLAAGKNREVNISTDSNKQVFFKDENSFVRRFFSVRAEANYRPAINTKHKFGIAYTQERVSDTVIKQNPAYFTNESTTLRFPELYYRMTFFDVDYIPYPTTGYAADVYISKRGFNQSMNLWQLSAKALGSWPVAPKTFLSLRLQGHLKLPFRQPFYNQRMLGYGDAYLQGYEYYVTDGVAGGIARATISRELFNFKINVPTKKGRDAFRIPFRVLAKVYGNTGYVHHPETGTNFLRNKMLYSGGAGIDIVTLYDFTTKLEGSFNAVGQNGLFLHKKSIY